MPAPDRQSFCPAPAAPVPALPWDRPPPAASQPSTASRRSSSRDNCTSSGADTCAYCTSFAAFSCAFKSMFSRMSAYAVAQSRRIFFKRHQRVIEIPRQNVPLLHRIVHRLLTHRFGSLLGSVVRISIARTRHSVTSSEMSVLKLSSSGARFTDCSSGSIRLTATKCFSASGSSR